MKALRKLFSFMIVLFLAVSPALGAGEPDAVSLTILHLNDLHGHILPYMEKSVSDSVPSGGAARLARIIQEEKSENPDGTLLLAAGDMFQGSPVSNLFHGRPVIEVMNDLKFDALVLGNHEFDWGRDVLSRLISSAAFPFLSANIADNEGAPLQGTKPYVILDRKGLKLAVLGVTTPETPYSTKPANVAGLTFSDPARVLPGLIRQTRSEGADLVIVLSHLGVEADEKLAEEVSGIDVIVGGHSHTAVFNPLKVKDTVIVQAGCYGVYLGALRLEVGRVSRKIVRYTEKSELKPVLSSPGSPVDENVAAIVEKYEGQIKGEFARKAGEASVDLVRQPFEESNIGDLLADAMREATGAQVAFQNGGGIRADLPRGSITLEEVYTLLPFDNVLVVMDLSGEQILQIMEQSGALSNRVLQVSGMKVEYDLARPVGSRVIKASVAGEPLKPDETYRVVTNDFLAAGGDRQEVFKEGRNVVYADPLRDAFLTYLQKHSPVAPRVEGRITLTR